MVVYYAAAVKIYNRNMWEWLLITYTATVISVQHLHASKSFKIILFYRRMDAMITIYTTEGSTWKQTLEAISEFLPKYENHEPWSGPLVPFI